MATSDLVSLHGVFRTKLTPWSISSAMHTNIAKILSARLYLVFCLINDFPIPHATSGAPKLYIDPRFCAKNEKRKEGFY